MELIEANFFTLRQLKGFRGWLSCEKGRRVKDNGCTAWLRQTACYPSIGSTTLSQSLPLTVKSVLIVVVPVSRVFNGMAGGLADDFKDAAVLLRNLLIASLSRRFFSLRNALLA